MGGRAKKTAELSFEDEALEALNSPDDSDFEAEAAAALADEAPAVPARRELTPLEILEDAVSGFTHGATLHNDATISDALSGVPGFGHGDAIRARNAEAQNRSPNVYGAMEMIGGFVPNALSAGAGYLGQGAGILRQTLANIGQQAGTGALQGMARGFGDSDPNAPLAERAGEAVDRGAEEGVLSALVAGGAGMLGGAANWGRDMWNRARNAAAGVGLGATDDALRAVKANTGRDLSPDDVVAMGDRLGITNAWGRGGKLDALEASMNRSGAQQDAAIRAADAVVPPPRGGYGRDIADDMTWNANNVLAGGAQNRIPIHNAMLAGADAAEAHPMGSLGDVRRFRTARGEGAFPESVLRGTPESAAAKSDLAAYDAATQQLEGGMQQAGPQIYGRYANANDDFSDASLLRDLVAARKPGNNTALDIGAGAVGAGIGTTMAGPFGGVAGAIAGPLGRRAAQNYGPDVAARGAGLMSRGSEWAGEQADSALTSNAGPLTAGLTTSEAQRQRAEQSRGYLGADAVSMVLDRNPQALGQYAGQLEQARQNGTLNGALYALYMRDPDFRTRIYPQIQQLTSESPNNGR